MRGLPRFLKWALNPAKNEPMPAKRGAKKPMSSEHKAALATGRNESRAVKSYLEALEAHKPKRGRKRTSGTVEGRLKAIEQELAAADPLARLNLIQEQIDLQLELEALQDNVDLSELEAAFVAAALSYSDR